MGWGVFRRIARPFENAAHSVGLSGGGITRRISREVSRGAKDVASFTWRGVKNVTAAQISAGTLGLVRPRWSGTNTAYRVGQIAGITAAAIGGGYAVSGAFTPATASTATATGTGPYGIPLSVSGVGEAGIPLASATPYSVAPISYGAIGTMGAGLEAGTTAAVSTASGSSALLSSLKAGGAKVAGATIGVFAANLATAIVNRPSGGSVGSGSNSGGYSDAGISGGLMSGGGGGGGEIDRGILPDGSGGSDSSDWLKYAGLATIAAVGILAVRRK